MPYRSLSQMRLFFAKEKRGELPKGTAKEWAEHTPDVKRLPERVDHGHSKKAEAILVRGTTFAAGFAKSAFDGNLPERAAEDEAAKDFTQVVKGSQLEKETGQARSGAKSMTPKAYPQDRHHRWRSSRG